jgi:hypothetical protein
MTMANTRMGSSPVTSPISSQQATRRSLLPIVALLALNGMAGVAVWHAMERPIETAAIQAPAAKSTGDRSPPTDSAPVLPGPRTIEDLPETARRPLFSVTRRPWVEKTKPPEVAAVKVAAPAPVLAPPYPADQLQLFGINPGNRNFAARALIRAGNETQGTWVQIGESIRGWTLREVPNDSTAILEARGERVELVTEANGQVGQSPQQPPAPLRR